jgi:glycerol-3-phosphate dehydrogenase (NAD(P)+)
LLGKGQKLAEILANMSQVAEGVWTARSVYAKAMKMGLEMPITTEVYRVLYENKPPLAAVQDLMVRDLKGEGW